MEPSRGQAQNPLDRAIDICGSQSELARRMGGKVATGHIYYWRRKGVPAARCVAIEEAVDGQVKRHELRPDIFDPPKEDGTSETRAA